MFETRGVNKILPESFSSIFFYLPQWFEKSVFTQILSDVIFLSYAISENKPKCLDLDQLPLDMDKQTEISVANIK